MVFSFAAKVSTYLRICSAAFAGIGFSSLNSVIKGLLSVIKVK